VKVPESFLSEPLPWTEYTSHLRVLLRMRLRLNCFSCSYFGPSLRRSRSFLPLCLARPTPTLRTGSLFLSRLLPARRTSFLNGQQVEWCGAFLRLLPTPVRSLSPAATLPPPAAVQRPLPLPPQQAFPQHSLTTPLSFLAPAEGWLLVSPFCNFPKVYHCSFSCTEVFVNELPPVPPLSSCHVPL